MEPGAPNLGGEAFDLLKHLRERDEATLTLRRDLFAEHCKPKDRPVKHTNVAALLTYWSEDQCDFDVTPEVELLRKTLTEHYRCTVEEHVLQPNEAKGASAQQNLEHHLSEFCWNHKHGKSTTLYIIYYAGHGWSGNADNPGELRLGGKQTLETVADSKDNEIVWNGVEHVLDRHSEDADVLLIFDCCAAGSLALSHRNWRTFEFLGACTKNGTTPTPGEKSFTRALVWALEEFAKEESGFHTGQLLKKIQKHPPFPKKQAPQLSFRARTSASNIWLDPVSLSQRASSIKYVDRLRRSETMDFRLHFTSTQTEDHVRKLGDWFQSMLHDHPPEGLTRITLEGKSRNRQLHNFHMCARRWVGPNRGSRKLSFRNVVERLPSDVISATKKAAPHLRLRTNFISNTEPLLGGHLSETPQNAAIPDISTPLGSRKPVHRQSSSRPQHRCSSDTEDTLVLQNGHHGRGHMETNGYNTFASHSSNTGKHPRKKANRSCCTMAGLLSLWKGDHPAS